MNPNNLKRPSPQPGCDSSWDEISATSHIKRARPEDAHDQPIDMDIDIYSSQLVPESYSTFPILCTPHTGGAGTSSLPISTIPPIPLIKFAVDDFEMESMDTDSRTDWQYDICLGMLLCNTISVERDKISNAYLTVEVSINGDLVLLKTSNCACLGLLKVDIGSLLIELRRKWNVQYRGFLVRDKTLQSEAINNSSLPVQVELYCNQSHDHEVGDFLSQNRQFLQHPHFQTEDVPYRNPHYFRIPGHQPQIRPPCKMPAAIKALPMSTLVDQVLHVFEDTIIPEESPEIHISPNLRTPLKDHQLFALRIMVGKEQLSRTVLQTEDASRREYRQQSSAHIPQNQSGGILADSMGLGKTLVTLTLIAGSLQSKSSTLRGPTLIVAPLSTMLSWKTQIQQHFQDNTFHWHEYHGRQRADDLDTLSQYDTVLTTYDTLVASCTSRKKNQNLCLKSVNWHRVVLDEGKHIKITHFRPRTLTYLIAHLIKDRTTKRFTAVCSLQSTYRWCLTGTPIQNRIEDFGSLLSFIRVKKFCEPTFFRKNIIMPLARNDPNAINKLRSLVQSTTLRRTKQSVSSQLNLPQRVDHIEAITLSPDEQKLYDYTRKHGRKLLEQRSSDGTQRYSSSNILQIILRLRQICNHGIDLFPMHLRSKLKGITDVLDGKLYRDFDEFLCEACGQLIADEDAKQLPSRTACPHILCTQCSGEAISGKKSQRPARKRNENFHNCPLCFPSDTLNSDTTVDVPNVQQGHYQPSSKVLALLKNLHTDGVDRDLMAKSVVFSSWKAMLDLVELALHGARICFCRLDGSISLQQREATLETFRNDANCTVMLATIQAAGVGLDLTAASKVHLLEPHWNPLVEEQAMDRIHRMGQTKNVETYRYIVKDSIDEYVVNLQQKKLRLVAVSFGVETEEEKKDKMKEWEELLR